MTNSFSEFEKKKMEEFDEKLKIERPAFFDELNEQPERKAWLKSFTSSSLREAAIAGQGSKTIELDINPEEYEYYEVPRGATRVIAQKVFHNGPTLELEAKEINLAAIAEAEKVAKEWMEK